MKPKLLIIRYADKVVLLVLLAFFAWSMTGLFRMEEEAQPDFREELEGLAGRLQQRLESDDPPPTTSDDDLEGIEDQLRALQENLRRATVVPGIRSYVFHQKKAVRQPRVNAYLGEEVAGERAIPGTDWEVRSYPEEFVDVRLQVDEEENATSVYFQGRQSTSDVTYNVTLVDAEGTEAVFPVLVTRRPPRAKPLPVAEASLHHSLGRIAVVATVQQPDGERVGDETRADRWEMGPMDNGDTREPDQQIVEAAGIMVYRKRQGAPDSDFERITPETVAPMTWTEFTEQLRERQLLRPVDEDSRSREEEQVVELQPERRRRRTDPDQEQDEEPAIHCLFVDSGVSPGENYTYRVVAVSSADPPAESEPVVKQAEVSPDIEFYVTSIRSMTSDIVVTVRKHVYNVDNPNRDPVTLQHTFRSIRPGDPIGGRTDSATQLDYWTLQGRAGRESADMFTGAYFLQIKEVPTVAGRVVPRIVTVPGEVRRVVLPDGTVEWRAGSDRRVQDGVEYRIRTTRPQNAILYLDKRGAIRAKYQARPPESPRVQTTRERDPRQPGEPQDMPPPAWW